MNKKKIFIILSLILIVIIFKNWLFGNINSGDFSIVNYPNFRLFAWGYDIDGLGGQLFTFSWVSFIRLIILFPLDNLLKIDTVTVQKIAFFFPFIILSFVSSALLYQDIFEKSSFKFLASIVFLFNTYILMIVGGGQIFVGLAYAIAPFAFLLFRKVVRKDKSFIPSIYFGLILSLQGLLDLRIMYVTLLGIGIYWLFDMGYTRKLQKIVTMFVFTFVIPGIIFVLIHSFWILPTLLFHQNPLNELGSAYSSTEAVKFFSFAKFEDSISLLHPNWPENIFGKVGFMRPEFLLIPILVFLSLLFVKNETEKKKKSILFFVFMGLIGAFLAKGANDPFGDIYLWLFSHIPGFVMFRDPTKWYVLVAISYSVLIPYSIWKIYEWLKSKQKFPISNFQFSINSKNKTVNLQNLFVVIFILFWLFTIRQAVFGQLSGTFKTISIPPDYVKLESFLKSQKTFSRTFWIPTTQRFGFHSDTHPEVSAESFYGKTSIEEVLNNFESLQTEKILQESSVKYVIVPDDSQNEIFLKDGKYDPAQYQSAVNHLKNIPWLREINEFGKIKVFEVANPKEHFWSPSQSLVISSAFVNPSQYKISINNAKEGDILVFSDSFDPHWFIQGSGKKIYSHPYGNLNNFKLIDSGNYNVNIYYYPQRFMDQGFFMSIAVVLCILLVLVAVNFRPILCIISRCKSFILKN